MRNIHPIYNIKTLMIKRELMKDEKLRNENWDRFLPKFKKKVQTAKEARELKKKTKAKWKPKNKEYTPFPPPQQPRKVDLQMESGEFFINERAKQRQHQAQLEDKHLEQRSRRKAEREAQFVAPPEPQRTKQSAEVMKPQKRKEESKDSAPADGDGKLLRRLKKKAKRQQQKNGDGEGGS